MGKVSLTRLTLNNFRSFEGNHEIEFDSTGLYLVRGFNHDTRGESGSGKSSLLLAIAYALDYSPYSAIELRSWFNEEPFYVELELATEKGPVVIHRGDKLWLKIGTGKKITSAKAVAEELDKLTGMNKKLREAITYRKQRTFGLFLSKRDSEKKEFLVELLGLHWLEEEIDASVKRVSAAEKEVDSLKPLVELCEKMLGEIKVPEAKVHDTAAQSELVEELRARVKELGVERGVIESEMHRLRAAENAQIKPFEYNSPALDTLRKTLDQCRFRINRIGYPEVAVRQAQGHIFRLQAEINKLFDDKCPRCDRTWEQAAIEMEKNHQQIKVHEAELVAAETNLKKLAMLRQGEVQILADMKKEEEKLQDAQAAHAAEMKRLMTDPNRLSAKKEEELRKHDAAIEAANEMFNQASYELRKMEQENELNAKLRSQALAAFMHAKKQLDEKKSKYDEAVKVWSQERDYRDMLRGFLGQIFAEVLLEISTETNRILANLPNASKMTMVFETTKETNEGKIKNEITPVAYFGGRQWPLESGASGGMFTSVELAVDLAVRAVISRRIGIDLNWLILDESFANGSDKVTKEGCLEILKQYSENSLIIVVEHASEFKEMFNRVIEIDYSNERSKIR